MYIPDTFQTHLLMTLNQSKVSSSTVMNNLALADVHANGAWVVILEVVDGEVTAAANLVAHSLASFAIARLDGVGVAGAELHGSKIPSLSRSVAPSSLCVGIALELADGAFSLTRDCVVGGLKVRFLGQHEHGRASLTGVRGRDIEVEDGADVGADRAVVRGAISLVGVLGVNGYNQMRVLVIAVEVLRAGTRGSWLRGRWRRRSWLGGSGHGSSRHGSRRGRHRLWWRSRLALSGLGGSRHGSRRGHRLGDSDGNDLGYTLRLLGRGHARLGSFGCRLGSLRCRLRGLRRRLRSLGRLRLGSCGRSSSRIGTSRLRCSRLGRTSSA
jgi:hypothetical protein